MAKYSDGVTEAMVGDVIEFLEPYVSRSLQDEVVHISDTGAVFVKDRANKGFSSSRMILVSRAPSPEPEQPKVNGVYASGEKPAVGDTVECVDGYDGSAVLRSGVRYEVDGVYCSTSVHLAGFKKENNFFSHRFKLISRKEQPKVNHEQSPPLVVWPEENKKLAFENLEINELFVFADSNDSFVRQKIGDTSFVTIAFDPTNSPNGYHSVLPDRAVRRLMMVQRPQFTVI